MARVRRNLFGSAYVSATQFCSQLAVVPVYLRFWGAPTYGLWLVLFTIPALFAFTDAGLSNAVGNAVTLCLKQGRPWEAQAKLNAAWKFQGIAWAAVFSVFGLLLTFCPLRAWLGVTALPTGEFIPTVLLLCVYSLASLQTGILAAIYRGADHYPLYLTWSGHARILETLLVILALVFGGGFVAVAAGMVVGRLFGAVVLYARGRRLLPDVRLAFFIGRWSDLRSLLPSGLAFLSFPVANALVNQGTVLVVNHICGASAVVLLSVCRQLGRVILLPIGIVQTAFQPEVTNAYASGNTKRVCDLQSQALLIPMSLAMPYVFGATFFGATVIEWWTRKHLGVNWQLILACSIEAIAYGFISLCALVPWSINRVVGLSWLYIIVNIIAYLSGLACLGIAGLPVIPWAFAAGNIVFCYCALRLGASIAEFRISDLASLRSIFALLRT